MNRLGVALPAFVVLALLPVCARAQSASISGTLKDVSGAVVPQARITAQNVATNAPRTALTDDSGIYRITNLAAAQGRLEEALAAARVAMEIAPERMQSHLTLAQMLAKAKQIPHARRGLAALDSVR